MSNSDNWRGTSLLVGKIVACVTPGTTAVAGLVGSGKVEATRHDFNVGYGGEVCRS